MANRTIAKSVELLETYVKSLRGALVKNHTNNPAVEYGPYYYLNYKLGDFPPAVTKLLPPDTFLVDGEKFNERIKLVSNLSSITAVSFDYNGPTNEPNYRYITDFSVAEDLSIIGYMEGTVLHVTSRGRRIIFPKSCKKMFYNLSHMTTISATKNLIDASNVQDMSYMFDSCDDLTNVNDFLKHFTTCSPTLTTGMFQYCSSLNNVNLGYLNLYNCTKLNMMFYDCTSLSKIEFGLNNLWNAETIAYMFYGCSRLTAINFNYLIDTSYSTIALKDCSRLFSGCSNLKYIYTDFRWNNKSGLDGANMFMGCGKLPGYSTSKTGLEYAKSTSSGGYFTPYSA